MTGARALHLQIFLLTGFVAASGMSGAANAGSTATRCDVRSCVHIHCNSTGDRCYRYADDGRVLRGNGRRFRRDGSLEHLHLICDSDGDRCYRSHDDRWDFRAYYRLLGYRWDDEAH